MTTSLAALAVDVAPAQAQGTCRTITADVVALDQPFEYNRYGAHNPGGMIYALRRDVVSPNSGGVTAGNVSLREDKRPRPLVLRANVGDCLEINFTNLLASNPVDNEQPATRTAGIHVVGMKYSTRPNVDDGANVGKNASSLVEPGDSTSYTVIAEREGTYLFYSAAATTGGEGNGGSLAMGLFGAINVEPRGSVWYRSQVTRAELDLASAPTALATEHPDIDYEARYPGGHPFSGLPILSILDGNEIVHGDLSAIIANIPGDTYPANPVLEPNRDVSQAPNATNPPAKTSRTRAEPFRENTVIFHDEIFAIQAFEEFEHPVLGHTLHGVRDGFAINYGTGGVGAEILANRKGVGHPAECNECKYEEFFLSSWAAGEPAMIVDVPASVQDPQDPEDRATKAFYPDDPSNVFHSYIGDHVKFRNLHAGPKEHHIFHLHAHQWLFTPNSDRSEYLDSQAIGPGSAYTYEIAYNGSGNRNQTVGDAIYHCHFYPHFAQGMWALWRNHDVFERGTPLDGEGRPAANSRAYPDAEIAKGTPIPAVVPLPTLAMAPMPEANVKIVGGQVEVNGSGNPGFPFFIPGIAGHRAPQPPLDFALNDFGEPIDGGLPRHAVRGGTVESAETRLDFSKENVTLAIRELPHEGTLLEQRAMAFHALRTHASSTPEGGELAFVTNGLPAKPGAPYADPCVNDRGEATVLPGQERVYKAAGLQLDLVFNKIGWHHPQARMLALWGDVADLRSGAIPPEPLFFRANSGDCIEFWHANLIPEVYELDDFQVRTPTDTLGQHIHLVKFDVTSSDGGGNGWNYEDGTFSSGEVRERLAAIKSQNCEGSTLLNGKTCADLVEKAHPFFNELGVQTTIQRWTADPVMGGAGDRTLRTVYTHDHFSPSTHQQTGLYAGLVIEPAGSTWRHAETGVPLGTDEDGGPTSWQAIIQPPDASKSYREFMIEFADFQLAYEAGGGNNGPDPNKAINPPGRIEIGLPDLVARPDQCPGGVAPPCPEAVSADDPGTFTVNYRNEPVALRVFDPATGGQAQPTQQNPLRGDLAFAFRSNIQRAIPALNSQPGFYPPLTKDVKPGDPFTPLLRAYPNDDIVVRVLVGAHEEGHNFTVHGVKWLHEPGDPTSGWRNTQMMGISEHFEFEVPLVPIEQTAGLFMDHFWTVDASADGLWNGAWGLLRVYDQRQNDLAMLPNNQTSGTFQNLISNRSAFQGACPTSAPKRQYNVSVIAAKDVLPPVPAANNSRTLVYNSREGKFGGNPGPLHDPAALLYVLDSDLNIVTSGPPAQRGVFLKPNVPVEPLVLRARAGDCIEVTLTNRMTTAPTDEGYNLLPMIVAEPSFGLGGNNRGFNFNDLRISAQVGLSPQLVARDVSRYDGWNVGANSTPAQTVSPGQSRLYRWYAGDLQLQANGNLIGRPVEFGAVNLAAADPIKQTSKGLIGALIIEPQGATWVEDLPKTRAAATVTHSGGSFREFVALFQDDLMLRDKNGNPICPVAAGSPCEGPEDPEDSGNKAINYRTEPLWFRQGFAPGEVLEKTRTEIFTNVLSNSKTDNADPQTPVFTAAPGQEVRFHVLQPGGHPRNGVFALHGHNWQRQPYVVVGDVPAQRIGDNPKSEWTGAQEGHGPANHFTIVPNGGAGPAGDYLYRNQSSFPFDGGQWGIFRVE